MLAADILARLLRAPAELLTGVVVAFIGAPFLLAALRDQGRLDETRLPPTTPGAMRARVG